MALDGRSKEDGFDDDNDDAKIMMKVVTMVRSVKVVKIHIVMPMVRNGVVLVAVVRLGVAVGMRWGSRRMHPRG